MSEIGKTDRKEPDLISGFLDNTPIRPYIKP